jgi:predicted anti-sigma-YlaC factor YlaD
VNAFRPIDCERARAAASAQIDGELSTLEAAFLEAHARSCESCGRFASEIAVVTGLVRWADLEQPAETVVPLGGRRRAGVPLRAVAALSAAAAVCVAVLTSVEHIRPLGNAQATSPAVVLAFRPAVADPPLRQPLAAVTPFLNTDASAPGPLGPRVEL